MAPAGRIGQNQSSPLPSFPTAVALGDFDGDGKLDAAVANTGDPNSSTDTGTVSILIGNGDGTFRTPTSYTSGLARSYSLVAADLNLDGKPDLVVIPNPSSYLPSFTPGNVTVLIGTGNGTFRAGAVMQAGPNTPGFPVAVTVGDADGDGKPDLAVAVVNYSPQRSFKSGVAILFGAGDGAFRAGPFTSTQYFLEGLAMTDFNGDGKPDLVVTNDPEASYLLGNGDGTFQDETFFVSGQNQLLAVTDFDGDGKPDMVLAESFGSVVALGNAFPNVTLSPSRATLDSSQTQQFTPRFFFKSDQAVRWSISPEVGTVSQSGLYSPPVAIAEQQIVGIVVTGVANPNDSAIAVATLMPSATTGGRVTSVSTVGGGPDIAQNTWIEIRGTNLAPDSTLPNGVTWSDAPEFAAGKMPTQVHGVSVRINGKPAYIYYVSPTLLNVLTPLDSTEGPVQIVVTSGLNASAPFTVNLRRLSLALLLFGGTKNIAATHADGSYLGPASLYPGLTTPASRNEPIVLYGAGFGPPASTIVDGSTTQFGALPTLPVIRFAGVQAEVAFAGVVSPGLYQFNVTVPASVSSGDVLVTIEYGGSATPNGPVINIQ